MTITAVIFALVFFTGTGSIANRLQPRLGLDLEGGTSVTLHTKTADGKAPSQDKLDEALNIIRQRVNASGVAEAEVEKEGDSNIIVNVPGEQDGDELNKLVAPAELRFRQVIMGQPDMGDQPDVKPATESAEAPPAANGKDALLAQAKAKVGDALWQQAQAIISDPAQFQGKEKEIFEQLKPFSTLTGEEVAVLPVEMQFALPNISCAQLDRRPPGSIVDPKQKVVACSKEVDSKSKKVAQTKYLLDEAKVLGTDVEKADYSHLDGGWAVNLSFTDQGQKRWTEQTKVAYNNGQNAGQPGQQVAATIDNRVITAPAIQGVITGPAQITGKFTKDEVSTLAAQLRFGSLPLTFEQSQASTVSPTLGSAQLRAGLLAAGIGMLLVVVYAFFYYRLLGTVIFLSLALSAVLVYGMLVILGRQIGFTLTLAGIAGFIVSLGVAADSFVIYFERLKDEIRDGRSPRSAVPRAWARARRTIISANAISILAAVVLYVVAVGTVKGFAFALGLATLIDLIVVFLFRHPIMAAFARTKAFLSPKVSGLGRVLQTDTAKQPGVSRTTNPKEA
ncbi:MAG: protein translocase subunit SecD [Longispora sp.]|nr:protein translocase subunit SecD [Longispora sp. (in: high G+C Gram-positive bacteria)]